jgi:uncharacterized membrane protein
MHERLAVMMHATVYALRGGFLVRPLVIALVLGISGAILSSAEEALPQIGAWIPEVLFPSRQDPQVGQAILGAIATSIMTVVSIVFAMLLMTLTLASTQFSPRILVSFVRDRSTQWTLGVFLGTFSYCIAALPAARSLPTPFVPVATIAGAMLLVLLCVGWLIFFINHISQSISVNHLVDRIARETELVIDELMPQQRSPVDLPENVPTFSMDGEISIPSERSGYIRFVDLEHLVVLAKVNHIRIRLRLRIGQFIPQNIVLMNVTRGEQITPRLKAQLLSAFDIGPARTMQQDVEFGVIQIVDIALRAISPAVNDPSTAISCIDQLSRILVRWINRVPPHSYFYRPPHILCLVVPWIDFNGLLDTAFEQIRHYSVADVAVSLRLLRAFADLASSISDANLRHLVIGRAERVVAGCGAHLPEDDLVKLRQRMACLLSTNPSEVTQR